MEYSGSMVIKEAIINMKKSGILFLAAGLALVTAGCGYSTGGEDSTVTVIEATPTPTPEPTPEATPTEEATPTPEETETPAPTEDKESDDKQSQKTSGKNVKADSGMKNPVIWISGIGIVIILILLIYFLKKKK